MTRRRLAASIVFLALAFAPSAVAGGGDYVFVGGSESARAQVRAALEASSFDWDLVRRQVTIRITSCGCAGSRPGEIVLDESTLVAPPFGTGYAWSLVQHEYAHQVAFFLVDPLEQRWLTRILRGRDWCYESPGLGHDDHACERFASTLVWAYWPVPGNIERAHAVLPPRRFKELLRTLVGPPRRLPVRR